MKSQLNCNIAFIKVTVLIIKFQHIITIKTIFLKNDYERAQDDYTL